ncbi:hypothetical protein GCM10023088_49120 [Actinomadura verrucosospora]
MTSTPQAIATSAEPPAIMDCATRRASCDEPHLGVHGRRGHLHREAGGEPSVARNVRGLHAELQDTSSDYMIDLGAGEAGSLKKPDQDIAEQLVGVLVDQPAVALADR